MAYESSPDAAETDRRFLSITTATTVGLQCVLGQVRTGPLVRYDDTSGGPAVAKVVEKLGKKKRQSRGVEGRGNKAPQQGPRHQL